MVPFRFGSQDALFLRFQLWTSARSWICCCFHAGDTCTSGARLDSQTPLHSSSRCKHLDAAASATPIGPGRVSAAPQVSFYSREVFANPPVSFLFPPRRSGWNI